MSRSRCQCGAIKETYLESSPFLNPSRRRHSSQAHGLTKVRRGKPMRFGARQRMEFVPRAIASRELSRCIVAKESQWTLSVYLCQAQMGSLDGPQDLFSYSRRDASLVGCRWMSLSGLGQGRGESSGCTDVTHLVRSAELTALLNGQLSPVPANGAWRTVGAASRG